MAIQHSERKSRARTSLRERITVRRLYPTKFLHGTARHLNMYAHPIAPTREQKNLLLTGLVLGCASIISSFFPACSLPAAITGLFLALYGRSATPLRKMSFWALTLSVVGLILSLINIISLVSTYVGTYLLR